MGISVISVAGEYKTDVVNEGGALMLTIKLGGANVSGNGNRRTVKRVDRKSTEKVQVSCSAVVG